MSKVIEATVVWNGTEYSLHPNVGEHPGMTVEDWLAECRQNGYEVTEDEGLRGRVLGAGSRPIYHLAADDRGEVWAKACAWEEDDDE